MLSDWLLFLFWLGVFFLPAFIKNKKKTKGAVTFPLFSPSNPSLLTSCLRKLVLAQHCTVYELRIIQRPNANEAWELKIVAQLKWHCLSRPQHISNSSTDHNDDQSFVRYMLLSSIVSCRKSFRDNCTNTETPVYPTTMF